MKYIVCNQVRQRKYYRDTLSALYNLEGDWRDVVENSHSLSEKQSQQQTALWELAETEVAYIKTLKVVTDVSKVYQRFFLREARFVRPILIEMVELIKLLDTSNVLKL